jgi:hypothetical protein
MMIMSSLRTPWHTDIPNDGVHELRANDDLIVQRHAPTNQARVASLIRHQEKRKEIEFLEPVA